MGIEVVLYGVRGTRPVTGRQFARYGSDTACVGVTFGVGPGAGRVLFDAGTGITAAGAEMVGSGEPVTIFLSHLHHDHLAGLPFFAPLFESERPIEIFVPTGMTGSLLAYVAPPYFPLTLADMPSDVTVTELPPDGSVVWDGVGRARVHSLQLNSDVHPRMGVTVYAVQSGDKRVVYATDFEWLRASEDDQRRLLTFAEGADVLIVDAQYAEDEYPAYAGRGHNTVPTAVEFGEAAEAGRIVLFHHDPHREDDAIDRFEAEARGVVGERAVAGRAGMRFVL